MGTDSGTIAGEPGRRRPGRPKKSVAQDTKAALLQAAVRLFAENGFAGTSIRAIAREVGLSESALYAHYGSKQAIFDAATERLGPAGVATVLADIDTEAADHAPAAFLRQVCERAIKAWDTEDARSWMSVLAREGLIHEQFLSTAIEGVTAMLAQRLVRWTEAGHMRKGMGTPTDLVFAFMAPLAQARILGLHAAASDEARALAVERMRHHTEFFVKAIANCRPDGSADDADNV
jgi:AcrR family transcriptional regulator